MIFLDRVRLRLRSIVLRGRLEREMQEEMAAHLERSTERLVARDIPPDEARRRARREFGNVPLIQEHARDARGSRWIEALVADTRYAFRHFRRTPFTTGTMFIVLVLGICVSTLLFSGVHSLAVQPPPGIADASDLRRIRGIQGGERRRWRAFSEDEIREFEKDREHFSGVAAWTHGRAALVVPGDAERRAQNAVVMYVTDEYFSVLGIQPIIGPGLPRGGNERAAPTAVIAHSTWEHLFNRDPGVVGKSLVLRGLSVTIVGVLPERFYGVSTGYDRIQLWMPRALGQQSFPDPAASFAAVAKLKPGVSASAASAAVQLATTRVADASDSLRKLTPSAEVAPLLAMNNDPGFDRDIRRMYVLVGLLSLLILLITCTNVSALLMGLATARRQEMAVRLSLGAARSRLLRQMLTQSVALAAMAGALALGLCAAALRAITRLVPELPFDLRLTWPATLFSFGVALAVGIAFGLAPALHGTRIALAGALRDSLGAVGGGRGRLQRGLVVAQITLTQPLIALVATILLIVLAELQPRRRTDETARLVSIVLRPSVRTFDATPVGTAAREKMVKTTALLADRFRAMPGVDTAVVEWRGQFPLTDYVSHPDDRVQDTPGAAIRLAGERVSSGYLATMNLSLLRGRDFAPDEVAPASPQDAQGVIIGTDVARRLWGAADPIGRRFIAARDTNVGPRMLTVVGVVDDPAADAHKAGEDVRVFLPPDSTQVPLTMLVRTSGAAAALLPTLRGTVQEVAPDLVSEVNTLEELENVAQRERRLAATAISAAGGMALLLSAIGLYAVVAFSVGRRTREIAVRMAVGAPAGRIVRQFVVDGVRLGATGLAIGLPMGLAGLAALHAFESDFPALPVGPVTTLASSGVLLTAVIAAWIPARRAATVHPAVTLRAE